jgi:hypothetical protein
MGRPYSVITILVMQKWWITASARHGQYKLINQKFSSFREGETFLNILPRMPLVTVCNHENDTENRNPRQDRRTETCEVLYDCWQSRGDMYFIIMSVY